MMWPFRRRPVRTLGAIRCERVWLLDVPDRNWNRPDWRDFVIGEIVEGEDILLRRVPACPVAVGEYRGEPIVGRVIHGHYGVGDTFKFTNIRFEILLQNIDEG